MLFVCILTGRKRAVFCDSTIHDRRRTGLKELAKRVFFGRCQGFFGYGLRSREYLMHYGVQAEKINISCQAASLPLAYSANSVLEKYIQRPKTSLGPRIIYVGRLSPEKGIET